MNLTEMKTERLREQYFLTSNNYWNIVNSTPSFVALQGNPEYIFHKSRLADVLSEMKRRQAFKRALVT